MEKTNVKSFTIDLLGLAACGLFAFFKRLIFPKEGLSMGIKFCVVLAPVKGSHCRLASWLGRGSKMFFFHPNHQLKQIHVDTDHVQINVFFF